MRPKVALKNDPILRYQVSLSRDLHMTFGRLVWELEQFGQHSPYPELALQVAFDEIESARASEQAARAQRISEQLRRTGGR